MFQKKCSYMCIWMCHYVEGLWLGKINYSNLSWNEWSWLLFFLLAGACCGSVPKEAVPLCLGFCEMCFITSRAAHAWGTSSQADGEQPWRSTKGEIVCPWWCSQAGLKTFRNAHRAGDDVKPCRSFHTIGKDKVVHVTKTQ